MLYEDVLAGVPRTVQLIATANQELGDKIYIQVTDRKGILEGSVELTARPDDRFLASVKLRGLRAGRHQGEIEIKTCETASCSRQYPGSPQRLAYDFEALPTSDLADLTPLSMAEWTTFRGDNGHSGYVPVSLDVATFSTRWLWKAGSGMEIPGPPVSSKGVAYVSVRKPGGGGTSLLALDEKTKSVEWAQNLAVNNLNPPSVADDRVYVTTGGHGNTALWSFDAQTGTQIFRTPFDAQWSQYLNPVIHAGKVYSTGGYYGGIQQFDALTGEPGWSIGLNELFTWTPTISGETLLLPIVGNGTGAARLSLQGQSLGATGDNRDRISRDSNGRLRYRATGIISASPQGDLVSVSGVSLTRYQPGGGIAWQVNGDYVTNPSIVDGEVLAIRGATLESRNLAGGQLRWSWTPPEAPANGVFSSDLLVTRNLIFMPTDSKVYAIDRSTRQPVWQYPMAGELSLSASGILYITLTDPMIWPVGMVAAVNVSPLTTSN